MRGLIPLMDKHTVWQCGSELIDSLKAQLMLESANSGGEDRVRGATSMHAHTYTHAKVHGNMHKCTRTHMHAEVHMHANTYDCSVSVCLWTTCHTWACWQKITHIEKGQRRRRRPVN